MFGYDYVSMNIFVTSQVTEVVLEHHFIKLSRIFEEIPGGANENLSEPFFVISGENQKSSLGQRRNSLPIFGF